MKVHVYYVCSFESPQRGDYNEYTQYTFPNMNKKIILNYPKPAATGFVPRDSRTSSNSRGKLAIGVRVIEVLLQVTRAPSEGSDKPVLLLSLFRVFAVHFKDSFKGLSQLCTDSKD